MASTDVRTRVRSVQHSPATHDITLLALRVALGAIFIGHGAQKLFGAFDGPGLDGAKATVANLGLQPESLWGVFLAVSEFGGGVLLVLGLLTLPAGLIMAANMAVATLFVHAENGFFQSDGGIEFTLILAVSALVVALLGPGRFSVDAGLRMAGRP